MCVSCTVLELLFEYLKSKLMESLGGQLLEAVILLYSPYCWNLYDFCTPYLELS